MSKKVSLEIGVDLLPDLRDALNGQLNVLVQLLCETYPELKLQTTLKATFDSIDDYGIKVDLGKIIRLENLANQIENILSKIEPEINLNS